MPSSCSGAIDGHTPQGFFYSNMSPKNAPKLKDSASFCST